MPDESPEPGGFPCSRRIKDETEMRRLGCLSRRFSRRVETIPSLKIIGRDITMDADKIIGRTP